MTKVQASPPSEIAVARRRRYLDALARIVNATPAPDDDELDVELRRRIDELIAAGNRLANLVDVYRGTVPAPPSLGASRHRREALQWWDSARDALDELS